MGNSAWTKPSIEGKLMGSHIKPKDRAWKMNHTKITAEHLQELCHFHVLTSAKSQVLLSEKRGSYPSTFAWDMSSTPYFIIKKHNLESSNLHTKSFASCWFTQCLPGVTTSISHFPGKTTRYSCMGLIQTEWVWIYHWLALKHQENYLNSPWPHFITCRWKVVLDASI